MAALAEEVSEVEVPAVPGKEINLTYLIFQINNFIENQAHSLVFLFIIILNKQNLAFCYLNNTVGKRKTYYISKTNQEYYYRK